MLPNHLIFCHSLLTLPLIFHIIRVFSSESALPIRWLKYWSLSFTINPSNEYSRLISFRIDWFDLLAVQGTVKNLLQHHSSKASFLQCSAFCKVQLSHLYMTMEKPHLWLYRPLLAKLCSCFSIHCLGLSWLSFQGPSFNFMAAVTVCSDFGAQESKICHCFYFFPFYLPWSDGTRCQDLSFLNVEF